MVRYRSVRVDDTELRDAIKRVSRERRRFGYRRIHVMIEREGHMVNHKKLRRIYTEEKLQVRRRGGRKRALGTSAYSGAIRPPVPITSGHPFRFDPAGDSGLSGHPQIHLV